MTGGTANSEELFVSALWQNSVMNAERIVSSFLDNRSLQKIEDAQAKAEDILERLYRVGDIKNYARIIHVEANTVEKEKNGNASLLFQCWLGAISFSGLTEEHRSKFEPIIQAWFTVRIGNPVRALLLQKLQEDLPPCLKDMLPEE